MEFAAACGSLLLHAPVFYGWMDGRIAVTELSFAMSLSYLPPATPSTGVLGREAVWPSLTAMRCWCETCCWARWRLISGPGGLGGHSALVLDADADPGDRLAIAQWLPFR